MFDDIEIAYIPLDRLPGMRRAGALRVKYMQPFTLKYFLEATKLSANDLTVISICDKDLLYSNFRAGVIVDLRDRYFIGCSLPMMSILKYPHDPVTHNTGKED